MEESILRRAGFDEPLINRQGVRRGIVGRWTIEYRRDIRRVDWNDQSSLDDSILVSRQIDARIANDIQNEESEGNGNKEKIGK